MKIDQDVLMVLYHLDIEDNIARIQGQLDRKLYLRVNKVLEACGGKWHRRHKGHVFEGPARPELESAINTGEVMTHQDLGAFETPAPLAERLVDLAGVQAGQLALEPSAGTGNIVRALLARGAHVTAVEFAERTRATLRERCADQLTSGQLTVIEAHCDFMQFATSPRKQFARVVMNPPFRNVTGTGDHLDHVQRAFQLLEANGVLGSVLPSGVLFRQDKRHKAFRAWADKNHGNFVQLEDGAFKTSGTSVRTCFLRVESSS